VGPHHPHRRQPEVLAGPPTPGSLGRPHRWFTPEIAPHKLLLLLSCNSGRWDRLIVGA
jgi:hypothetical protein